MEDHYHVPVMGHEVAQHLIVNKDGTYLDGTLGGGAHAELILSQLSKRAVYIGIDRDMDAINKARERLEGFANFKSFCGTFDEMNSILDGEDIKQVDGLLLDLGVSSWQIDQDLRGFSFRPGVDLDMRMDRSQDLTAEWIVNNYSLEQLKRVFKEYGEERFSGKIAFLILKKREENKIEKSTDLLKIIDRCVNPRFATKSYARIFQALRIEVNNELNILKETLELSINRIIRGGKLAIITYHSLEDRIVKQFMQKEENPCVCPPELPVCSCHKVANLKRHKPNFILASQAEIDQNPRARSAKLRIAEKIKEN
jgi:16S rRNA (cytosine1402-N4)-methyltransferase